MLGFEDYEDYEDYGGLWRIMEDYGGLWRIMEDYWDYGGCCRLEAASSFIPHPSSLIPGLLRIIGIMKPVCRQAGIIRFSRDTLLNSVFNSFYSVVKKFRV
jgi:hypothetical protein